MAQKFDKETFEFLMKDNQINDEKFKEFHKKMFDEMIEKAIFLACDILKKKEERPGVGDFEEKMSILTKEIVEEKIKLLGSYLIKK